jgi:NAD(P)-dependent dehydrogenase (short-subunit alcohol dehydrogenase family)
MVDRSAVTRAPAPKVALVTGAGSGIGQATAASFARVGYIVAVNDQNGRRARRVARAIGGRPYAADVADAEAIEEMVARIESTLGPIEVAVSNAGHYRESPITSVTAEAWRRMLRVHLGGAFNLARVVIPSMRQRGSGSIVIVSSELALTGSAQACAYATAKAALLGLAKSLAREVAPHIRVNVVAPGPVDTPLLLEREREPDAIRAIPMGRLGRPDEIASAIVHIAGATYTTGAVYSPNGGTVIQ